MILHLSFKLNESEKGNKFHYCQKAWRVIDQDHFKKRKICFLENKELRGDHHVSSVQQSNWPIISQCLKLEIKNSTEYSHTFISLVP